MLDVVDVVDDVDAVLDVVLDVLAVELVELVVDVVELVELVLDVVDEVVDVVEWIRPGQIFAFILIGSYSIHICPAPASKPAWALRIMSMPPSKRIRPLPVKALAWRSLMSRMLLSSAPAAILTRLLPSSSE